MNKEARMGNDINIVISTIGRRTLTKSIESCIREGFKVIVVSDGIDIENMWFPILNHNMVTYVKLGHRYGLINDIKYYGQIATTTGYYLSNTEFTATIDDDDEFEIGAGDIYRSAITSQPDIDIWIPILKYEDGHTACHEIGNHRIGNISHPIYRTRIFSSAPRYHIKGEDYAIHDFHHVDRCVKFGYKIGWLGKICILIRP